MAPLVSRYLLQSIEADTLTILYIAPTKALVNDLEKRLYQPLCALGLRLGIRHGDRDDLTSGAIPHVLITTPESLDVMLFRKDAALQNVRAVVIDEVHLLYNSQRGLQLSILLRRLQHRIGLRLQWAAISATAGRLSDVRDFLMGTGEDAVFLTFPSGREIDAQIRHIATETDFLNIVRRLTEGRPTKLLVFANSRRECERLAGILHQDERLRPAVIAHYSSLSPEVRVDTEHQFARASTAICIATSTLELGIDIGDIDLILLWGAPHSVESFLQRIGRGNRRGNKTNALCLIPDDSPSVVKNALQFAALVDAAGKGHLPVRAPYDLFGAMAQQALSLIASDNGRFTRVANLCEIVSHVPHLDRSTVESILAELAGNGYLQRHGFKNQYGADESLHRLVDYRLIYGNYGAGSQVVAVYHGAKILGEVPAANLLRVSPNSHIRFAGKVWLIQRTGRDGFHLRPARATSDVMDFVYTGGRIPLDAFLADRIWSILHAVEFPHGLFCSSLRKQVLEVRDNIKGSCSIEQVPYFRDTDGYHYFTFAGHLVNKAIALAADKPGFEAGDLSLRVFSPVDWSAVSTDPNDYEDFFHLLFEPSSSQSIYQQMLPLDLQMREYLQDWLRDKTIRQILVRLNRSEPMQVQVTPWRLFV